MSAETEVVYESPWRPKDEAHPNAVSLDDFVTEHGLIPEFLPFDYLSCDVIRDMISILEFLDTRLDTKQIVSTQTISDQAGVDLSAHPETKPFIDSTALLIGWWDAGYKSIKGRHYANPNYVHPHDRYTISIEDRHDFFTHAARLGIDCSTLGQPIGVHCETTRQTLAKMAHRAGVSYSSAKKDGIRSLARTWKTINHWGYTYPEIGKAFQKNPNTIMARVCEEASDFDPPDDPSIERHR